MIQGNRCACFLEADEIDHLTIRYTDFNEKLNKKKASYFIRKYLSRFDGLREKTGLKDISDNGLRALDEETLYDALVTIRTFLLEEAFTEV